MRRWGTSDVQQLASLELARAWLTDPEGGSCEPATIALEAAVPLASGGASCRPDGTGTTSAGIRVAVEVATGVAANLDVSRDCRGAGVGCIGKPSRPGKMRVIDARTIQEEGSPCR